MRPLQGGVPDSRHQRARAPPREQQDPMVQPACRHREPEGQLGPGAALEQLSNCLRCYFIDASAVKFQFMPSPNSNNISVVLLCHSVRISMWTPAAVEVIAHRSFGCNKIATQSPSAPSVQALAKYSLKQHTVVPVDSDLALRKAC